MLGPDYKASFHDGIAFYPVLGQAYPKNLPVTWRTQSVACGGEPLAANGDTPRASYGGLRFTLATDAVVEAYEMRAEGLAQTGTIARWHQVR